jgi:hypothetical protein
MRGTVRQNVQKTIPVHLQPPYEMGPLFCSAIKSAPLFIPEPPVKIVPPVTTYSWPKTCRSCS